MGFIRSGFRFWLYNLRKSSYVSTASVEEVIDEHYANQISQLQADEKLKDKIIKFRMNYTRDIA